MVSWEGGSAGWASGPTGPHGPRSRPAGLASTATASHNRPTPLQPHQPLNTKGLQSPTAPGPGSWTVNFSQAELEESSLAGSSEGPILILPRGPTGSR